MNARDLILTLLLGIFLAVLGPAVLRPMIRRASRDLNRPTISAEHPPQFEDSAPFSIPRIALLLTEYYALLVRLSYYTRSEIAFPPHTIDTDLCTRLNLSALVIETMRSIPFPKSYTLSFNNAIHPSPRAFVFTDPEDILASRDPEMPLREDGYNEALSTPEIPPYILPLSRDMIMDCDINEYLIPLNTICGSLLRSTKQAVRKLKDRGIFTLLDHHNLSALQDFLNGVLVCTEAPTILPASPSINGNCQGDLAYFNFRLGPRDARMFYGPGVPYIAYGSQSQYTCLGIWIQDVRSLLEPFHLEQNTLENIFEQTTELRRPAPWKAIEKNFFLFWDGEGKAYAHHDLSPDRVFAQIDMDGTIGADLAPLAAAADQVCMSKYMPHIAPAHESIHQATNSLSITLCKQSDLKCTPDDFNTFVLHIFHHKSYYDFHSVYEPFVLLFRRTAPFAIYAISQRPLWIYGRNALTNETHSLQYEGREEYIPSGHTEMFYITSMSWRTHGQKYHGYIDEPLLLAFGIEHTRSAIMDVLAGDLLHDLAFC